MRRLRWLLFPLLFFIAGCGNTVTKTTTHVVTEVETFVPPTPAPCSPTTVKAPNGECVPIRIPSGAAKDELGSGVAPEGAVMEEAVTPQFALPFGAKHIDRVGLLLIEKFEGFSLCQYWDPFGHIFTRGFGETAAGGFSRCLRSRAEGEANLKGLIESKYEFALRNLHVSLNQHQWDALCSFVWNLGTGIFNGSQIGRDLKAHRWNAAANDMLVYVHAGNIVNIVLAGLVTRRHDERHVFLLPVPRPKTPQQVHAERVKLLHKEQAYFVSLTKVLARHNCDVHKFHHPLNASRGECVAWINHHAHARKEMERLHRLGVR